jgi:hypothetical protein
MPAFLNMKRLLRWLQRGLGLSLVASLAACISAGPPVPRAIVTRVPAVGMPMNSDAHQLAAQHYIEEEFYVEGKANRYRIGDSAANATLIDGDHPYLTRALVRRPADPSRFNGTVVVEWLNVSIGSDADFVYGAVRELLLREGYAWVGVSAQRVGVEGLVKWDAGRYGKLSVAASNKDPLDGHDIDPPKRGAGGDVLAWDVFSQVGAALAGRPSLLLNGMNARRVIAAGQSQSSFRLGAYYNSIQPLHRVYDGFLLYDRGPEFALRTDVAAKLVSVGTEFMHIYLKSAPQPDSANQRWWEIAGASHNSLEEITAYMDPQVLRAGILKAKDGAALSLTDFENAGCATTPVWSRVPNGDVLKAALKGLDTWLGTGVAPPMVARLAEDSEHRLLRDAHGQLSGGVHTAAYGAPRAANASTNAGTCTLAGYHIDFTPRQMCARYGSQGAYVAGVREIVDANLAAGVLLPEEAEKTVDEARQLGFDCSAG